MDDTQLLEGAARAMGRSIRGWNTQHGASVAVLDDDTFWQPLHENHITDCMGDALRLAVKLGLSLRRDELDVGAFLRVREMNCGQLGCSMLGADPYAATRRAIVRAAAAMVKA